MLELLAVPLIGAIVAYNGDKFKSKVDDKKKIQVFFETAGIAIKRDDKLHYPKWDETKTDDRSITYIYKLPLGMPSKVIQKVEEVVSEGLNKKVIITYDNYKLKIRVFHKDIPEKWNWSPELLTPNSWKIPMGQSLEELHHHNFEHTPHMNVGGLTRKGKTVFLKQAITSLIVMNPNRVHFFILDLKGGLEFARYKGLKQVVEVAETPQEAHETLMKVLAFMEKQMSVMKKKRASNITETDMKDRFFVIVDEGAELAPDRSMPKNQRIMLEQCQGMLSHIARIGGALGVRLIFCTQYPTGDTLPRQVKQNSDAKLGFRLPTLTASQVVIDESGLENLKSIPGRALFKTDRIVEIQVPLIEDEMMWNILKQYEVDKGGYADVIDSEAEKTDGTFIDD